MATTYDKIATTTLGSAAASITFSSIAASWTDLRVVMTALSSDGIVMAVRFNGDTGTNYSITRLYGDGTSAISSPMTAQTSIACGPTGLSATIPSLFTVDVFSYAGSTYKTSLVTSSQNQNSYGATERIVGLWRSTAAITSVSLNAHISGAYTLAAGTTATLYGIKSA